MLDLTGVLVHLLHLLADEARSCGVGQQRLLGMGCAGTGGVWRREERCVEKGGAVSGEGERCLEKRGAVSDRG